METYFAESSSQRANQICANCRRQKRKCDKAFPACGSCQRTARQCDYESKSNETALLKERIRLLEQSLDNHSRKETDSTSSKKRSSPSEASPFTSFQFPQVKRNRISNFPSAFFLDTAAFAHTKMTIPRPLISIPQILLAEIGTLPHPTEIAEAYFQTTHIWLPIIWKRRIYQRISDPNLQLGPDLTLLLSAMKLSYYSPCLEEHPAQITLYNLSKQFLATAEDYGLLSIEILQAAILIAMFEIGHGIYPAAYMTIGRSARLGQVMGLHDRKFAPPSTSRIIFFWRS